MKKFAFLLFVLLPSMTWAADKPFSKDLLMSLQNAMTQLQTLETQFPELNDEKMSGVMFDTDAQLALIDAAGATPAVEKIVTSAGFDSIESFLGYAQRMMSSMFSVMKEQMPAGLDMGQMIQQQEGMLQSMKSQGLPAESLKEMEQAIAQMKTQATMMDKAVAHAKPEDVSFMRDNLGWVMQQMEGALGQ